MRSLRHPLLRLALFSLASLLFSPLAGSAQPPAAAPAPATPVAAPASGPLPAMVILVRHAEKSTEPKEDPALTEAGAERAKALASTLADSGVTAIITTQWRRTQETAAPLAIARGLTPEVVATVSAKPVEAHAEEIAEAVGRHPGGVVLVVGHSNTLPAILAALGGPKIPDLADSAYSDLFLVTPGPGEAHMVRAQYGAPSPAPAPAAPKP